MKKKGVIILVSIIVVVLCVVLGILLFGKGKKVLHEVTFDSDGGTPIESQLVEDGTTASIPVEPKKEGHSFLYWSLRIFWDSYSIWEKPEYTMECF